MPAFCARWPVGKSTCLSGIRLRWSRGKAGRQHPEFLEFIRLHSARPGGSDDLALIILLQIDLNA
jgi:hypothetical protein